MNGDQSFQASEIMQKQHKIIIKLVHMPHAYIHVKKEKTEFELIIHWK